LIAVERVKYPRVRVGAEFRLGLAQGDLEAGIGSGDTVIVDTKLRSRAGEWSSAES
jgi:hypothetical protein